MRPNTFCCHELDRSAYLWARGIRLVAVEPAPSPNNPNHVVFKFYDPDGQCGDEVSAYERGAEIPAQQFALAFRQLKDQVFRRIRA